MVERNFLTTGLALLEPVSGEQTVVQRGVLMVEPQRISIRTSFILKTIVVCNGDSNVFQSYSPLDIFPLLWFHSY